MNLVKKLSGRHSISSLAIENFRKNKTWDLQIHVNPKRFNKLQNKTKQIWNF